MTKKQQFYGLMVEASVNVTEDEDNINHDGSSSYRPSSYRETSFLSIRPSCEHESPMVVTAVKPEKDKLFYIVSATYNSGDSFGIDYGYVELLAAFDNEQDALELRKLIHDDYNAYKKLTSDDISIIHYKEFDIQTIAWKGYFNFLEKVDIVQLACE